MKILHLSYDYPDIINPNKTQAIKNIINTLSQFADNYCISLNRTGNIKNEKTYSGVNITSLSTFGLPRGVFFPLTLLNSIRRVLSVKLKLDSFDIIYAHKLTFEGPIAYYLCKKLNKQLIVAIQQTDFKVLKYKPLMVWYYYRILQAADKIILISPWMKKQLEKAFGSGKIEAFENKLYNIPLIVENEYLFNQNNNNKFFCAFHMRKNYIKIKNIYRLLIAIKRLKDSGNDIKLDIAGDGAAKNKVAGMIKKLGLDSRVKLIGKIYNSEIVEFMSRYKAFVLCSYPETFGMVYVEALYAGIPVIYSKECGIDGFFDDDSIGIKVRHNSISDIMHALMEINNNQSYYRQKVKVLQQSGKLKQFTHSAVLEKYRCLFY